MLYRPAQNKKRAPVKKRAKICIIFGFSKAWVKYLPAHQNILRFLNTQNTAIIDNPIRIRAMTHDHPFVPNHPN